MLTVRVGEGKVEILVSDVLLKRERVAFSHPLPSSGVADVSQPLSSCDPDASGHPASSPDSAIRAPTVDDPAMASPAVEGSSSQVAQNTAGAKDEKESTAEQVLSFHDFKRPSADVRLINIDPGRTESEAEVTLTSNGGQVERLDSECSALTTSAGAEDEGEAGNFPAEVHRIQQATADDLDGTRIRAYVRSGPPVFTNPLIAGLAVDFEDGFSAAWPPTDYVEALIVVLGNVRSSGGEYAVLARGPDGQFGLSLKIRSPRRIAVSKNGGTMFGREDEFLAYAAFENALWMNSEFPVTLMTKVRAADRTFLPPYPNNDTSVTLEEFAAHMRPLGVNLRVHRSTSLTDFLLHWSLKRLC